MLDQQDKVEIRTMIREETLDLGQNVSILQQDVSGLKQDISSLKQDVLGLKQDVISLSNNLNSFKQENTKKLDHLGVLMEDNGRVMQLILENLSQNNKKIDEIPEMKNKMGHHEIRIGNLELAMKKNPDLRLI